MKQRNIILSLIVGLLIISGVFFSGIFSIIGIGDINNEVCVFNETNKECTIQVEVPENRAVSFYTFDMDFASMPEAEFKGLTTITPFATGTYIEEDDRDLTSSLETRVYYHTYLYRLPSNYNTPYEIRTTAEMFGAKAWVTRDSAWSQVQLETGYFYEDYPYTTIEMCNEYYNSDCRNDYYLVKVYDNSKNEAQVSFSGDVRSSRIIIPDRSDDVSTGSIDKPETDDIIWQGTNLLNTLPFPYENLAIYTIVEVEDEEQGYAFQTWSEPSMTIEYKEAIFPSNVEYGINNRVFDTFEGENLAGQVKTSLDIASQINDYCGRNDNATGKCVFDITITSDTIGKVIITDETLTLAYAEGDTSCATKGGCYVESEPVEEPVVEEPLFDLPLYVYIIVGIALSSLVIAIMLRRKRK